MHGASSKASWCLFCSKTGREKTYQRQQVAEKKERTTQVRELVGGGDWRSKARWPGPWGEWWGDAEDSLGRSVLSESSLALPLQGALPEVTGPLSKCLVGEQDCQLGGLSSQLEGGPPAPYTHQRCWVSHGEREELPDSFLLWSQRKPSINTVGSLNYPHEMFNVFSLEQRRFNKMFPWWFY